jgi:hypothetical protein
LGFHGYQFKNPSKAWYNQVWKTVSRMRDYFTPWRVIMTVNQELYAKALEITVLMLGNQGITANMHLDQFQMKIMDYDNLARKIAQKIINAPGLIPD